MWLPCQFQFTERKSKKKDEFEEQPEIKEDYLFFLVTSDRTLLPAMNETLRREGLRLRFRPSRHYSRWSLKSIIEYVKGNDGTVNPKKIYNEIYSQLKSYIEFQDDRHAKYVTLWIMATYFIPIFRTFPYIFIHGTKRVGKTKLLTLIQLMAFNGVSSVSITTSSIFRMVEELMPTICFDETEKLHEAERGSEWRAVILGGYKYGTGEVWRTEGDKKKHVRSFRVFSPKAFANIHGIENVLEDRVGLYIILLRSLNPNILNSEVNVEDPIWQEIRDKLYLLFMNYFSEVSAVSEVSEDVLETIGLQSRDRELWKPIITLAKFIEKYGEENLTEEILNLAKESTNKKQVEDVTENTDCILAQTLLSFKGDEWYYVKDIKDKLVENMGEDEAPRWLNTKWVGRALKRLGFDQKRRLGRGIQYFLDSSKIHRLLLRLGVSPETTQTSLTTQTSPSQNPETVPQTSKNLSFNDLLPELRRRLQADFTEADFTVIAKQLGLSETEAKNLFVRLKDEGCLAVSPYGLWKWVKL